MHSIRAPEEFNGSVCSSYCIYTIYSRLHGTYNDRNTPLLHATACSWYLYLYYGFFFVVIYKMIEGDALHPIRYETEALFFNANTHERLVLFISLRMQAFCFLMFPLCRISTEKDMNARIAAIQSRRGFVPWNKNNPNAEAALRYAGGERRQGHFGPHRPASTLISTFPGGNITA